MQQPVLRTPSGYPRQIQRRDRIGVVLFHWGGPSRVKEVHSFLRRVYDDKYVRKHSWAFRNFQAVFSWLAAASMREKVQHELSAVGGNCPAIKLVNEQVRGLESKLVRRWGNRIDVNFRVYAAMQYARPFAHETARQMRQDGIKHVILIPAYLQESNAGRQKSVGKWHELVDNHEIPQWPTHEIPPFGRAPRVLTALSERIDQTLQRFPKPLRSSVAVIFCAPGIPGQDKAKFQAEVLQVSQEVMQQRKEKRSAYTAFYAYYGHIGDHLRELKKKIIKAADVGNRCVMLLPLCGTTENLQTTYSMDIACRDYASRAGIHHFEVAEMLNSNTLFLETLSDLIGEKVESSMKADVTTSPN